jgi:hypothetical protein
MIASDHGSTVPNARGEKMRMNKNRDMITLVMFITLFNYTNIRRVLIG